MNEISLKRMAEVYSFCRVRKERTKSNTSTMTESGTKR